MNAVVGLEYSTKLGTLDLTECFAQLLRTTEATTSGDTTNQEAVLAAQIVSMNAIYTDLASMARHNMASLDVFERLLRLALKAQSNCRATADTLAAIQNPPTVFARQANIVNGPQQVNNAVASHALAPSRTESLNSAPNKLLEAHGERVDGGAAKATRASDQGLATVGALDRPPKCRRQGTVSTKRR